MATRNTRSFRKITASRFRSGAIGGIEKANPETLYGIFGDAQWTNQERLSDALLRNLIEHCSRINLGNATAQRAQSFLTEDHIQHIVRTYETFADEPGFSRVVSLADIRAKDGNLSIPLYVAPVSGVRQEEAGYRVGGLEQALEGWLESVRKVRSSLASLLSD